MLLNTYVNVIVGKMAFAQIIILSSCIWCISSLDTEWWKHASIYQIYPKSFKDSDGDGIGDFKGIISKLDYLVDIGIDTIYLNPFHPSSNADGGYDVTNYKAVDSIYGTMEDFEQLMKEIKSRGLYFIMDLVINHSSDEHEWFQKSIDKVDPYTNYYIWSDPKGYDSNLKPIPPNNWFCAFQMDISGSAWTWDEKRKQFYFHQCMAKQPDLNLRNEAVKSEIKSIMKFWIEKGVSGFRVDAPMMFMEDDQLRDNLPLSADATVFTMFSECKRTFNHPDSFKFINELNVFLRKYDRESGRAIQTPMIGETYGPVDIVMKYYGTKRFPSFHLPFNFLFTSLNKYLNARELHDFLHTWLDKVPKGRPSNWALGNHDFGRITRYFNPEYNFILLSLVTMLPGTVQVYYGEELSMGANHLTQIKDRYERIYNRAPMHWDDTRNAGFTTSENPWLTVYPDYWHINVQNQENRQNSSLNYFKDLMSLRKTDTSKYGDLKFYIISKWMLAFSRTYKQSSLIIVMNLGTETHPIDLNDITDDTSTVFTMLASSPNSAYKKGFEITPKLNYPLSSLLRPHSVVILGSNK